MARRKRCVVKRRRKEEEKRRKGGKNCRPNRKKRMQCASFSSAQSSFFGSIRNTLFREKHTISAFVFMQDIVDEQIM